MYSLAALLVTLTYVVYEANSWKQHPPLPDWITGNIHCWFQLLHVMGCAFIWKKLRVDFVFCDEATFVVISAVRFTRAVRDDRLADDVEHSCYIFTEKVLSLEESKIDGFNGRIRDIDVMELFQLTCAGTPHRSWKLSPHYFIKTITSVLRKSLVACCMFNFNLQRKS